MPIQNFTLLVKLSLKVFWACIAIPRLFLYERLFQTREYDLVGNAHPTSI